MIRYALLVSALLTPLTCLGADEDAAAAAASISLGQFVTTGTRTMQRITDSPVRTESVTAHEIQRAGFNTLADAIESVPGIRLENNCQNCGTSEILMLGLDGKYTAVLLDGVPVFSGLAAVYGLDQIPAAFIEQIEVVKGGGSSVYGSGAVGGVVNVIGRNPARNGGVLEARYDSIKGQPALQFTAILDRVEPRSGRAASIYAQRSETDPVDLNHDGFSDLTWRRLTVAGVRLGQQRNGRALRLDYNRTAEFRRGGNKFELPDNLADISERIDTTRDAASAAWTAVVSPDFDYQASASFARIARETFYGGLFGRGAGEALTPESAPGVGDNDQAFIDRGYATHGQVALDQFGFTKNRVYNLEAQGNYRLGGHHLSLGAQFYRETIDDHVPVSPFVSGYPVPANVAAGSNVGVFLQDDWHPAPAWDVVAGVRLDRNSELKRAVLSPRVNIKWVPTEQLAFRATYGTGFRAPQPFDEDLHIELVAGERARTVEDAALREERSWSGLVSGTWNPRFAAGRLTVEAAAFRTVLDGTFTNSEIRNDPASGDAFRLRFNGPSAEIGGVELNVGALPFPALRLDVGYVGQMARFREPVVLFDDGAGHAVAARNFLETPRHYGVAQATYTRGDRGSIVIGAAYTGAMSDINLRTGVLNERTETFLTCNISLSQVVELRGLPRATVSAGVRNLFDRRQRDLESGADRDPYYLYGPRTPRTFTAAVRLDL